MKQGSKQYRSIWIRFMLQQPASFNLISPNTKVCPSLIWHCQNQPTAQILNHGKPHSSYIANPIAIQQMSPQRQYQSAVHTQA
ncbi:hypothetical protein FGO68_gene9565 [Halteria grandinella]|uniref:Uncharacterized protein n=1 Tax=Halteria grandinella TaxID=5974 RepID=A0A8J8NAW7_HALGN|nr:hypothetical protein FGO68_gene9565 [Halteria grandinella]